ncbi:MAG: acyltransferase [Propionibacterium sp.]|nr:acyltransferase [Propionibacterium sp.]
MSTQLPRARRPREVWVDVAKGIAIALVVLDHSRHLTNMLGLPVHDIWHWIGSTFASVRMPAFFMMSGFFLYRWKTRGWRSFFKGRIQGFVYLYFVWATVYFVVDGLVVRHLDDRVLMLTRSGPIQHILRIDTPLWYLMALPLFSLIWWATRKWPAWIPLGIAFIGYIGTQWGWLQWPSVISTVGTIGFTHYLFAFLIGARLNGYIRDLVPRANVWHLLAFVAVWMTLVFVNPPIPGLRFFVAVPSLFIIAAFIARSDRLAGPFVSIGKRTLPVYVTHWLLLEIQLGIGLRWLEQLPEWSGWLITPGLWVSSTVLAILFWKATNRWHWLWARPDVDPVSLHGSVLTPPQVSRPTGYRRIQ